MPTTTFQIPVRRVNQTDTQKLVPMGRIELPTSPLPRECSATELHGLGLTTNKPTQKLERVKGIEPSS